MNLTIINDDKAVYVDGTVLSELDLSTTGIPTDVHALQWKANLGWIEFKDTTDFTKPQNEVIQELPQWATNCISVFNAKIVEIQARQKDVVQPISTGTMSA